MNDTRSNRFTPVTVGMAIALFMLALVVDKANAWSSVCNQCIAVADREAKKVCGTDYICYFGENGFSKYKKEMCEDTKICPSEKEVGSKDCTSVECHHPKELLPALNTCPTADEGGGWICANDCLSMGCGTKSEGKGCKDVQFEKKQNQVGPSTCFFKCACE